MREIVSYRMFFTPNGAGRIEFRLKDEGEFRTTDALSAHDFAALGVLLAQKKLAYDPGRNRFASSDINERLQDPNT